MTELTDRHRYYADTAYNSQQPRDLDPPRQQHHLSAKQKLVRQHPIDSRGLHCREYLSYLHLGSIEILNDTSEENLADLEHPGHEYVVWDSFSNPKVWLELAVMFLGLIAFASTSVAIIILFVRSFEWNAIDYASYMIIGSQLVYRAAKYVLDHNWVKSKNNILVNRRTGLVTFSWKRKRIILPFDEFDVCMPAGTRPTGSHDYYLRFVHKYSDKWFQAPAGRDYAWEVEQDWEFWQQYMDISQPLPDVPQMEPFRDRDPVTAAWDREQQRPKDYWKNLPLEHAKKLKAKSRAAAERYPWGLTREQALNSGWRASGVGEGDWQTQTAPQAVRQHQQVASSD